jgi:alpha-1,2-mannosyltransferase
MSQRSTPLKPSAEQGWLSSGRIHRQAFLLAIALWVGYGATMATPGMRDRFGHLKGADFLHSYILGTLALDHRGDALYDPRIQREIGEQRVPESAGDYFLPVYGPQYSLLWLPLAKLPYGWAAALWIFLSAAIYAVCCYAVWRTCQNLRPYGSTVALVAAVSPGFFSLITFGQNSALALACFTAMYFALRARRQFLAGLCLGLLAYKPQLGLVPACIFLSACVWPAKSASYDSVGDPASPRADRLPRNLITEGWKVVTGAALAIAAQVGIVWLWYGAGPLLNYARVVTQLGSAAKILEPKPYLMHSLRAFWDLLLPWPSVASPLYILTAVTAIALAVACWRMPVRLELRFAVMLLATVLVAPHLTVYDLVILVPAFLWIADWLQSRALPVVAWLLFLSYVLPFAGPLARWTHLQISVIALAVLTLILSQHLWREQEMS